MLPAALPAPPSRMASVGGVVCRAWLGEASWPRGRPALGPPSPWPTAALPLEGLPRPCASPTSVSLPCLQGSLLGTVPEGGGQRSPSTPSKQKMVQLGSCPVSPDSGHRALLPARPRPGHPSRQSTPWRPAGLAWDRLLSATWGPISQSSRHSPPPTEGAGLDSRQERARGSGASAQVCRVPTGLPSGPPQTRGTAALWQGSTTLPPAQFSFSRGVDSPTGCPLAGPSQRPLPEIWS